MIENRFTGEELLPFWGLLLVVVGILLISYFKGYKALWSPVAIVGFIFGYYCCLGPYQAVISGETFDRLRNMRPFYVSALWGAFIALMSYLIAFALHGNILRKARLSEFSNDVLFKYGRGVFLLGFFLFTVSTGGNVANLINPLDAEYVQQRGDSLGNYFGLSLNFVIPGLVLIFISYLNSKKNILWFILPFAVCVGIFITLGFRYRLVLLLGALAISYYYSVHKKPNFFVAIVSIGVFITLMGVINLTRTYGAGLNTSKLEGEDSESYYKSGLRESMIFQTSGAVIDIVPENHPYAGFAPIVSTLLFPIPSSIYSNKSSGKYLFDTLDVIYGEKISKGAAILSYGEYYLAFGWTGIVVGYFLLGWYSRKLWNWYLLNQHNPLAIAVYSTTVVYLYVIISRGYLPQVTMLFFFTVFPIFTIVWLLEKKRRRTTRQIRNYVV